MRIYLALLALAALLSPAQPGQPPQGPIMPEQLLPADCLAYFRYDGYETHRKAYDQTAIAKVMSEGLSEFFEHVLDQLGALARAEDDDDAKATNDQDIRRALDGFLGCISRNGFALAVELAPARGPINVDELFQLTIVFPHGAKKANRQALEDAFRIIGDRVNLKPETVKAGKRSAQSLSAGGIQAVWWPEGDHLMLALGVRPLGPSLRVIDGARPNLTAAPWYADFKAQARYETDMRGRVDLKAVVDYLAVAGLDSPRLTNVKDHLARHVLLRHFGLHGLTNLTFHLGFNGKYQRSTVRLGVVEPDKRNGLLTLLSAPTGSTPISTNLAELPPLPTDTDYVSVRHVNWEQLYDYAYSTVRLAGLAKLFEEGLLQDSFPDLDHLSGGDFRKDFLQQLGTTAITWGGHSEGPFFLGQGFAVKVKDVAKVRKSLTAITAALAEQDKMFAAEKRSFRGKEMHVFSGLPLPISFALHEDWLIAGLFPQAVQGVLLRSGGKYRAWQAPPEWAEALAKEQKRPTKGRLLGMSVSDPRPVVTIGLSLLPTLIHAVNFSNGKKILDVAKIPHAQTINEWLFPNVAFVYDQGNALCWEHHYSMNEPDDFFLLVLVPTVIEMGLLPFELPARPRRTPQADPLPPPPVKMPVPAAVPPPVGAQGPETPKNEIPLMARASAVKRGDAIWIQIITTRKEPYTITRTRMVSQYTTVLDKNGTPRQVKTMVPTTYIEALYRTVEAETKVQFDGKTVEVTRKDGTPINAGELVKLLAKETEVLYVPNGTVDRRDRQRIDERTLIIRKLLATAPPLPKSTPGGKSRELKGPGPQGNSQTSYRRNTVIKEKGTGVYRTPILPPIRAGDMPENEDPPDRGQILSAISRLPPGIPFIDEVFRDEIDVTTEKLLDKVEAPRFYPLVGPAQLHRREWKCTVRYTENFLSTWPMPYHIKRHRAEVVYIDQDHLHLVDVK